MSGEHGRTMFHPALSPLDCPVCKRPGWAQQRHVQRVITRGQLPDVREVVGQLLNDADGQLREFRCGPDQDGLWHPTNLTASQLQAVVAPTLIELPPGPARRPPLNPPGPWTAYQAKVSALLKAALVSASVGLGGSVPTPRFRALPGSSVLAKHYGVSQAWARKVYAVLANDGHLRCIGGVYVVIAEAVDDRSAS